MTGVSAAVAGLRYARSHNRRDDRRLNRTKRGYRMERRSLLRNVYLFSDFSDAELGEI